MNGICHKTAGISTGIILTHCLYQEVEILPLLIITVSSELGSLIPDIDEPNSIVGRKVRFLSSGLKKIFGHRGIIHTPFFLTIISIIIWFVFKDYFPFKYSNIVLIGFISGYLSHLLLDFLTPTGIMLWYPFSKKKRRILSLKGEHRDMVVLVSIILGLILFLLFRYEVILFDKVKAAEIATKLFIS